MFHEQQELEDRITELERKHGHLAVQAVLEDLENKDLEDLAATANVALDEAFE